MNKLLIITLTVLLAACTENNSTEPVSSEVGGKPLVVVSNYPLYFFATQIAGQEAEVRFPSIEGDPAMWAPADSDVGTLQRADLLILNGAGYEAWLAFATLPRERILDTTKNAETMLLPMKEATVHQHGPQGEHSHEGTAFTTWLDPLLAIEQARAITLGLSELVPAHAGLFQSNFESLEQRLIELDRSLAGVLSGLADRPVVFSHPVYQYLQNRYAINGRSLHWEPDVEPGTRDWIDFGNLLREHPARLMVWEAAPTAAVQERLSQEGVESVVFNPVANTPKNGDYFNEMEQNLQRLQRVIAEGNR